MGNFARVVTLLLICGAQTGVAWAQKERAEDHGQNSLGQYMQVIRGHLMRQGVLRYTGVTHNAVTGHSWTNRFSVEATNIVADLQKCELRYHWRTTVDDKIAHDSVSGVPFGLVTETSVISMAEDIGRDLVKAGRVNEATSFDPEVWVVHVERADGAGNALDFRDEATARIVLNAVRQAARLCR